MDFPTFATTLYGVASSNLNKGVFCKTLFENITDLSNAAGDPLDMQFDTYRAYMRGKTPISTFAKSINAYLEPTTFSSYIDNHLEGVILNIAKAFKAYIPDIDDIKGENVGDKLAELFESIIIEASQNDTTSLEDSVATGSQIDSDTKNEASLTNDEAFTIDTRKVRYDRKNEVLCIGDQQLHIPKSAIPDTVEPHEKAYIDELLSAYSDANGQPLNIQDLKGKYKRDYLDQRVNYFSARDVERFSRESIDVGVEETEIWKSETFDYIKPTLWDDYDNGFKRLLAVMAKVVDSRTTSVIDDFQNLVSPAAKKGICHLLVSDGRMKWVDDNE